MTLGRVEVVVGERSASRRGAPGLRSASPKRPSNSDAPTPVVTVSSPPANVGPSTPLSGGGAAGPSPAGAPPSTRRRDRSGQLTEEVGELPAPGCRGDHVERGQDRAAHRRLEDPGLVRAVEAARPRLPTRPPRARLTRQSNCADPTGRRRGARPRRLPPCPGTCDGRPASPRTASGHRSVLARVAGQLEHAGNRRQGLEEVTHPSVERFAL